MSAAGGAIRALERRDLAEVAALYQRVLRSKRLPPPPGLAPYFERTLLEHPWADAEIPSLVYETGEGRIAGLIGSHVRRASLEGREIRIGVSGQLVSDPEHRQAPVGALLMRRYLTGPQQLTITDGATGTVHQMWVRLGGRLLNPESVSWIRPLRRPAEAAGDRWLTSGRRERWRRPARPLLSVFDAAARSVTRPAAPDLRVQSEELAAEAFVEHREEMLASELLRVDYDVEYARWLFAELTAVRTRGELVRRVLRRDGQVLGWYVVYLRKRGMSSVIEIVARRGAAGTVLDQLFAEAWEWGAAALEGRVSAPLFEPLWERRCLLNYGARVLFHSRDPEIEAAVARGDAALSRLDGEWWMGHHVEPFG